MENYEVNLDFVRLFRVYVVGERDVTAKIEHEPGRNVYQDGLRGDSSTNE